MSTPKKRRARPTCKKVKGCYECSQRRISCDKNEPSCAKCLQKGITCSGQGIRYRFNHGVASRGRLAGKNVNGEAVKSDGCELPRCSDSSTTTMAVPDDATPSSLEMGLGLYIGDCLDSLPPAKRNLVRYFATEIAPHMVAIDDDSNGYRVLVLPAAEAYGSVLNAVLAASAYHMSHRMESSHRASQQAQSYYTQAINDLRHIPPGSVGNGNEQMLSILTIFVMLISTMITGCSDFPILYKMLTSLFKASSQGKSQDQAYLREFLVIQMRKFELYANPFIDEKQVPGDTEYTNFVTQGLTCLRRCAELHPEHAANLARTSDLISQAGLIYSLRARNELAKESSFRLVEEYKTSLARFSPTTAGWKVLIWATFIVAAESSDTTHRAFLLETLEEQYRRNGFGNLRTAMDMLRDVWNRGAEENWTKRLPQWKVFVM